jgi:hypothetical protein
MICFEKMNKLLLKPEPISGVTQTLFNDCEGKMSLIIMIQQFKMIWDDHLSLIIGFEIRIS